MEKIQEAVKYIQSIYSGQPSVGIVLGSVLGSFTGKIKIEKEIFYSDIPNFPVSTVKGQSQNFHIFLRSLLLSFNYPCYYNEKKIT